MIVGFFDIRCHLILERQHTFYIHIACSCDQILFICILTCQLESDQVTTVIHISTIHGIIGFILPAGRLHTADTLPRFCRHQILSDARFCRLTSSKLIQFTVFLIGYCRKLFFRKLRLIIIYLHIWLSWICRNIINRHIGFTVWTLFFGRMIFRSHFRAWLSIAVFPWIRLPLVTAGSQTYWQDQQQSGQKTISSSLFIFHIRLPFHPYWSIRSFFFIPRSWKSSFYKK